MSLKQIIFIITLVVTIGIFCYSISKIIAYFKLTKPWPVRNIPLRIWLMLKVAFFQTKIFRHPIIGLMHAWVFWGFLIILFGTLEMTIDGIFGTEHIFSFLGPVYDVITALIDVFALLVLISVSVFLFRRLFLHIKRFYGLEMKKKNHQDANFALTLILILMLSLLGMNMSYYAMNSNHLQNIAGFYPISKYLSMLFFPSLREGLGVGYLYEIFWWMHILLIFFFANILPYSKHFHIFMSVPNVFLSRLEPLGKLVVMEDVLKEVKLMLSPDAFATPPSTGQPAERFGVLDVEDATWKNYFDSLSCTQCGRCTSVCPANITGKKLSPRKVMMDFRARMNEKGPQMVKTGKNYNDNKSLINDYISTEEIWACTTCNACAQECPININHPSLIIDLRRYLVMEKSSARAELNMIFKYIENNGAPWQFSLEDRMLWAEMPEKLQVPIMSELIAKNEKPEYLLWIGCAGAFDDRYKKVSRAIVKILNHLKISYAVLGKEETCTGDPSRRAGNEMLFLLQALTNIETFKNYEVKKILTLCPHCYNTFKNEYSDLGFNCEVIHYTQFFKELIAQEKLQLNSSVFSDKIITYHDPCYLGRANEEYSAPRKVLKNLQCTTVEMKRNKSFALCCGAGGGQMFKEAEHGEKEIFIERTEEALSTGANIIASSCPFCMTMLTDGLKYKNKEGEIFNYDIAELIALALKL